MATANQAETSREIRLGGRGSLRLSFLWIEDRYQHRVEWRRGSEILAAIESEGSSADPAWPPSPPLQQLNVASAGGQPPVFLLVGMAGRSHWSASAEAVPERGWRFDLACRCQRAPGWLGSTYRIRGGEAAVEDGRIVLRNGPCLGEIIPQPRAGWPDLDVQATADRVALGVPAAPGPLPVTVRWQYLLGWAAAGPET